jgi:hypothetical protein
MNFVARLDGRRNIADESLQRSSLPEHSKQNITAVDLCETAARQLQIPVRDGFSESPDGDNVTHARLVFFNADPNPLAEC